MNKNVLKVAFVAAFVMISVCKAQKSEVLSDIALANVEALSQNGQSRNVNCPYDGYGCKIKYTNGTYEIVWGKIPGPKTDDESPIE